METSSNYLVVVAAGVEMLAPERALAPAMAVFLPIMVVPSAP